MFLIGDFLKLITYNLKKKSNGFVNTVLLSCVSTWTSDQL